jgi:hypothetical protein
MSKQGNLCVSIELDKIRNIRLGYKATLLIEENLEKPIQEAFKDMQMRHIAVILHAGLSHEDKELTLDKVIDLVDEKNDLNYIMTKVNEAFEAANGIGDEGKNKIATAAK